MSQLGKQWEVLRPHWQKKVTMPATFSLISVLCILFLPSVAKLVGLLGLVLCGAALFNVYKAAQSGLVFHDNGVRIRLPGKQEHRIDRQRIEHFEWEAEDIREDDTHTQLIHFSLAWTDSDGNFREIDWEENFPPGSIKRLQRAFERPALSAPSRSKSPKSSYWDE